jgi:hypothetical protein
MAWEPETFSREQRRTAAKAVVRAQVMVDRLDRNEFGAGSAALVARAYLRVDDMLAMLLEDLYTLDEIEPQSPPSS